MLPDALLPDPLQPIFTRMIRLNINEDPDQDTLWEMPSQISFFFGNIEHNSARAFHSSEPMRGIKTEQSSSEISKNNTLKFFFAHLWKYA
jgi:hypothetical protein